MMMATSSNLNQAHSLVSVSHNMRTRQANHIYSLLMMSDLIMT